jgi:hypothetical protein
MHKTPLARISTALFTGALFWSAWFQTARMALNFGAKPIVVTDLPRAAALKPDAAKAAAKKTMKDEKPQTKPAMAVKQAPLLK